MKKWIAGLLMAVMMCGMFVPMEGQAKTISDKVNLANAWNDSAYVTKGCLVGDTLYYNVYAKLYKMNVKTGKKKLLRTLSSFTISNIQYYKGKLYLSVDKYQGTGGSYPYIAKINTNGKSYKQIACGDGMSISETDGKIFYVKRTEDTTHAQDDFTCEGIYSMNTNGGAHSCLIKTNSGTNTVYNGKHLFYTSDDGVIRVNKNGKSPKQVASSSEDVIGVIGNYVYFTLSNSSNNTDTVYKRKIGAKTFSTVVNKCGSGTARMNPLTKKLYYASSADFNVKATFYEMNLTKNTKVKLFTQKNIGYIHSYTNVVMYSLTNSSGMTTTKVYNMKTKKTYSLKTYYVS